MSRTIAKRSIDTEKTAFIEQPGYASWEALDFQPDRPVRYSYSFTPSEHGCDLSSNESPTTVVLRAEGDLDGDGVRSRFERRGTLRLNGSTEGETLYIHQRVE